MVPVEQIEQGQFFRKRTGTYVYLRMSDSSAKFCGLDPAFIYGVCFNGNIAKVKLGTMVVPAEVKDFLTNIDAEAAWNKQFGHGV